MISVVFKNVNRIVIITPPFYYYCALNDVI